MPYARNAVIERASTQLKIVADLKTIQVHTWLNGGKNVVLLAGELREVAAMLPLLLSRPDDPDFATAKLNLRLEINTLSDVFPLVRSVSVLHPETGRVLISTDSTLVGRDRREEDYYREGRKGPFISPVHYSLAREEPVLIVSAPAFSPDGEPRAVFTAELNLSDLAATISSRSGLGQSGEAYLVDHRGYFITLPEKIEGGPPLLSVLATSTGVQRAIAGQSGIDTYDDSRGVPVIGVYRWLSNEQMALLVEVDEAEIVGHIRYAWTFIALTILVLLCAAAVAAHRLAGWLGRPLAALTDAAHALRGGDLTRRVPSVVEDEIGQLAAAFNEMAAELERSYDTLGNLLDESTTSQQRAEARLASVVDTAFDAIISTDGNLRIIMFNQAAERMLECPASEAIGEPVWKFMPEAADWPGSDADADTGGDEEYRLLPTEIVHDTLARQRGGGGFPAEVSISSAVVAGGQINTLILRDITERKRIEEEIEQLNADLERRVEARTRELREAQTELVKRERLATLGQLTATVSHEIRNPLGAMRTSLYVIEKTVRETDPNAQKSVDRIKRSIKRCDNIIDELLDFSRSRELDLEPTPLDDWLAAIIDEQHKPDPVSLRFEPGLPEFLASIDRERLRRAVINVLENAIQAVDENGAAGTVTLSSMPVGDAFEIRVTDSGPGVPADQRDRVFEPLFSTRNFGVGLGLAITRQIVEQHGGAILVEEAPEGGACFIFGLPVRTGAPVDA